jgi:hypothetical protein
MVTRAEAAELADDRIRRRDGREGAIALATLRSSALAMGAVPRGDLAPADSEAAPDVSYVANAIVSPTMSN